MASRIRKSTKSNVKLRIGLGSVSGKGKTMGSLLLAYGMTGDWDKICFIDSEDGRGELYTGLSNINDGEGNVASIGSYNYIRLDDKSPEDYLSAIKDAESAGCEVIIIDSITHAWEWCLQKHADLGGKFSDWGKVNPMLKKFTNAILMSKSHIITTVRKDTKHIQTEENGKTKIVKAGLDDVFKKGFEYELTLRVDIDSNHLVCIQKDNTHHFGKLEGKIINVNAGKLLMKFVNETIIDDDTAKLAEEASLVRMNLTDSIEMIEKAQTKEDLLVVYNMYPELHGNKDFKDKLAERKASF